MTDGHCGLNSELALQELNSLRSISWKGLRTYSDFAAFGRALRENADRLEEIELDAIEWDLVKKRWNDTENDIADSFGLVLRIRSQSTILRFPALQRLSISGLDLTSHSLGVAHAVNATSLRSVTIRRCPDQIIRPV